MDFLPDSGVPCEGWGSWLLWQPQFLGVYIVLGYAALGCIGFAAIWLADQDDECLQEGTCLAAAVPRGKGGARKSVGLIQNCRIARYSLLRETAS
jgi:hypothetical protein